MAGAMAERNRSLKEALFESLSAILSPAHDIRAAGEEQVKALEVTEEFGVHLAEFTVDPSGELAIRQLASVLLKQYVEAHWSQHSEKYRAPETSDAAKTVIRQILPLGLQESISKVRSSVAYAVSAIAHWDWPEAWPQLFHILMEALTSGNQHAVHGAMRVLTEFCREVTDSQMPQVAPVILPEMFKIFTSDQTYGIRTRGRAVDIFNTCAGLILAMNEVSKGVAKQLLYPVLPQFTEAFIKALQVTDGHTSDSGLKKEILNAITTLVKNCPSQMAQCLPQILVPVWNTLTHSADVYVRTVVNDSEEADDPIDSDGEVLGFENLVYSIFEFIHGMVETPKLRKTIKKSLTDLVYYILLYMQMTQDQVRMWSNSPDQFVEDEDDDTFTYSVRISAQDLLLLLSSEFPKEAGAAICSSVSRHIQEADVAKAANNPHWWKVHEATMLGLGSVRQLIIEAMETGKLPFDVNSYLQKVVLVDLNQNCSPFLLGRCLWVASRYAQILISSEHLEKFLQATVSGLHPNQSPVVRISAVRAVYGFCDYLSNSDNVATLKPLLPDMMEGLITIATQFSSEVLALCIETLTVLLKMDPQLTASYEPKITPLTLAIFLKYTGDPLMESLTQDVFKTLSQNPGCLLPVQQRLLPTLVSVIQAPPDKIPAGMQAVSLDILETLVRCSTMPLSEALISNAFPACVQCTLKTDDNSTMQSGGECLRAYVSKSLEQISQWHDGTGNSGIYYVVQVISRLLDPKTSEYTATFVGRLVSILISKMGSQLGSDLDLMLRAVLTKLQQAETLSVIQSLVLVFAHLIHCQMEAVLEFLSSVPDPMGKPALAFVLSEWCSKQHLFYGAYEGRVSTIALSKLLQHAIEKNDVRLQGIEVKGDQVFHPSQGIRTRSKVSHSPDEWTKIPVLVKIYKLLINELSNQIENAIAQHDEDLDDEEDDEDELEGDWGEEENGGQAVNGQVNGDTLQALLSQMSPASDYIGYDMDDDVGEEEDEDAANDPINQINLKQFLTDFLLSLSQQPYYSQFTLHHNDNERKVLHSIGIHV